MSVYVQRISKFLERFETVQPIPLNFFIAVSPANNQIIVPIDEFQRPDFVTIHDYVHSFLPNPTAADLKQLAESAKLTEYDVAMSAIDIYKEEFVNLPDARAILNMIDSKADMDWSSIALRLDDWVAEYREEARIDGGLYAIVPVVDGIISNIQPLTTGPVELLTQERSYPFANKVTAIQLFDKASTSFDIPFVSIQNARQIFYKIHTVQGLTSEYYNTIL
jgi:hypothetical protein